MMIAHSAIALAVALIFGAGADARAATDTPAPQDLSLEDLLKADVVTASRKSQAVQDVPSAVYVISREDIERSGAASLPEALRLVPGVEVARLSSGRWAVSVRGFNSRFANKLLVLMDGRSIYSPLFSGVLWEMEGTLLEDIDRIEVIRGPGAALWGANAVNGVINILTRKARDTQGSLVAVGVGNVTRGSVAARFGGSLPNGHFRVWAQTESQRRFDDAAGAPGNDAGRTSRIGFRADSALANGDSITVSGSVADNEAGDRWYEASLLSPTGVAVIDRTERTSAAHVLARYSRLSPDGSETIVQAYAARSRVQVVGVVNERRTTVDLDVQHHPRLEGRHDLVWGATARASRDDIAAGDGAIFDIEPTRRGFTLASVFVNDEITLVPERLRTTLGARLEHNNFTGLEPQAHARLAWTPNRTQTLWTAVSRAVRTPSRAESDARFDLRVTPAAPPVPAVLLRSPGTAEGELAAEKVTALEFGCRQQIGPQLSVDFAAFRQRYTELLGSLLAAPQFDPRPFPHVVQLTRRNNSLSGVTRGWEFALDWRATPHWRLQAAYSALRAQVQAQLNDPVSAGASVSQSNSAPRQQLMLRSSLSLGQGGELDARLRRVGSVQDNGIASIPAYTAFDLRYALSPMPGMTVSISGENLLHRHHAEFRPDLLPSQPLQVPRSVHVKAQWLF